MSLCFLLPVLKSKPSTISRHTHPSFPTFFPIFSLSFPSCLLNLLPYSPCIILPFPFIPLRPHDEIGRKKFFSQNKIYVSNNRPSHQKLLWTAYNKARSNKYPHLKLYLKKNPKQRNNKGTLTEPPHKFTYPWDLQGCWHNQVLTIS